MHDADAIRQCRQGNAEAFRHLVQRYQRRALGHARALTGNDADAADAAQDAFSTRSGIWADSTRRVSSTRGSTVEAEAVEAIELLLEKGADTTIENRRGLTPAEFARASRRSRAAEALGAGVVVE